MPQFMSEHNGAIILISIPFILLLAYECSLFWAHDSSLDDQSIDRCLDNGGCWDYQDRRCRKIEANAQELCDRAYPGSY